MGRICGAWIAGSPQRSAALVRCILCPHVCWRVRWRLFRLLLQLPRLANRASVFLRGRISFYRARIVRRRRKAVGRLHHAVSNTVRCVKCSDFRLRNGLTPVVGQHLPAIPQREVTHNMILTLGPSLVVPGVAAVVELSLVQAVS